MRRFGMESLSKILNQAMDRSELADAAREAKAVMLWAELVGPQMAKASEARGFQGGGTLLVVVRNSAWIQEFTFQKEKILARFRERLGKDVVRDLRFSVGTVRGVPDAAATSAPPEAEIRRIRLSDSENARIREASHTGDPELSQAIRRALTYESQLRQWHLEHGAKPCPRCGAAYRTPQRLCPACRQDDLTANERL